ncbi:hypothetical protein NDU88_007720 [Pleurodeles waltl]|uniref:Uncharacterized protein n=1 Tax=Pleurodeles waltl TaxID=8319 RepID=A0AAV7QLG1_PLEWA|nr:hypothetical protein NDU88_007720 [Pleurodeles waltl]
MAENCGPNKRCGTASNNKGRHQEEVEQPTGKGPKYKPHSQEKQGPRVSGSGHTVQGTQTQEDRDSERTAVRQGEDRLRELTVLEELTNVLGAYQQSQDKMGQILDTMQENQ